MPGFDKTCQSLEAIPGSVYSRLAEKLRAYEGEVYPLHVGDTWMEPPRGCRMENLTVAEYPGMHRYAPPRGRFDLIEAVVARVEARQGVPTTKDNVLIAAGGTGALGAAVGAIADPGEEVLLLAPYWPLIEGIVRSFHGTPVAVPFFGNVATPSDAVGAVAERCTDKTVALYFNSPNNPSGIAMPPEWVAALTEWARAENLWILADEVYEDYVFDGVQPYARPLAPERTFSVHSFSKAFGMAGNRCGYVVGPPGAVTAARKVSTHTFYSTPTAAQIAALRALDGRGDAWAAEARKQYRDTGRRAAERLGIEPPGGSTFLFLDVADHLDERGLDGLLEDCADQGLLLAPGPSFGPYPTHVRLCYTAAPPDVIGRGIEKLAGLLGR